MKGLIVDSFAGGGGASTGIEAALGRPVDIAVNHDATALALHRVNHPGTSHFCRNVWQVDPAEVVREHGPVALAWFSPDCTHHSKAKGGKPREQNIRDLAWVVVLWAERAKPDVIMLENVEEFRQWGPLTETGQPCPQRKGSTFDLWRRQLKKAGYTVAWKELRACDYGAPTIRKRLFVIARRDGLPIVWPAPTHGAPDDPDVVAGAKLPWRTAAECIDWSLPCPSIFLTRTEAAELRTRTGIACNRPLAEATMRRIAKGLQRYVIEAARPYIVPVTHRGDVRAHDAGEPLRTVTTANGGEFAVVSPYITKFHGENAGAPLDDPLATVTANSFRKRPGGAVPLGLISPYLISASHGDSGGRREYAMEEPLGTLTAHRGHALVAAFMAQHNEGPRPGAPGREIEVPLSTITASGSQQGVVAAHMMSLKGSARRASPMTDPLAAVCAQGTHASVVAAFLQKYYGEGGQWSDPAEPMHTVPTRDRMGLVTVTINGEPWTVVDIGMRMLTPRELFRAQGFPDSYIIDRDSDGNAITKARQIRACGNSVCPPLAQALVAANCSGLASQVAA